MIDALAVVYLETLNTRLEFDSEAVKIKQHENDVFEGSHPDVRVPFVFDSGSTVCPLFLDAFLLSLTYHRRR
jgi:hypothetical protein